MHSTAERRARACGLIETEPVTHDPEDGAGNRTGTGDRNAGRTATPASRRRGAARPRTVLRERFRDTCPLDRYHAKGRLTRRQWTAGCRFEALWRAASGPSLGAINLAREIRGSYRERLPCHGYGSLSPLAERAGLARREHDRAPLQWTPRGILVRDVCVFEQSLAGGKQLEMLARGLDQFADALRLGEDPDFPD
ncbi:hypothetical protein IHV25_00385 [Phaeovibrio sulfidiphilus]|uniref:Uncharacterized protein n=1 Tax=Phaeovibrio sulfidiphilus TaxID=1220600 RepID=A0A8J6YKK5_9PROT|nr:hypothetical protein [Phaeovibrio sulfidiphilus]MBE1236118.1 hypothetical protein [Phaeovibrio sulfidiphilus]